MQPELNCVLQILLNIVLFGNCSLVYSQVQFASAAKLRLSEDSSSWPPLTDRPQFNEWLDVQIRFADQKSSARFWAVKGYYEFATDDKSIGRQWIEKAYLINPQDEQVYLFNLVTTEDEREFSKLLTSIPDHVDAREIVFAKASYGCRKRKWQFVIDSVPESQEEPVLILLKCIAYVGIKDFGSAKQNLATLKHRTSGPIDFPELHYYVDSISLLYTGQIEAASIAIQQGLSVYPHARSLRFLKLLVFCYNGKANEAMVLAKELEQERDDDLAWSAMAEALIANDQLRKAVPYLNKLIASGTISKSTFERAAMVKMIIRDYDSAADDWAKIGEDFYNGTPPGLLVFRLYLCQAFSEVPKNVDKQRAVKLLAEGVEKQFCNKMESILAIGAILNYGDQELARKLIEMEQFKHLVGQEGEFATRIRNALNNGGKFKL